jgi:DNA-binding CsgD family transcriptional regulator
MLALHQADPDRARAALDRAVELLRGCPDQHFPYWGLWALLRTLADDDGRRAREEAAHAAGSDTSFNRALLEAADGVAAGRRGDPAGASQAVEQAVAVVRGYEGGDWLVHLLGWLLAPAALAGSWGRPVTWLQDAVRWFGAHGYEALASACRLLLRDAHAPVPRHGRGASPVPDALAERGVTSREMDVLWLVAGRLSNRQIAERLVLSPKTVEKHVASLLHKTGAAGRAALIDLAGEPPNWGTAAS